MDAQIKQLILNFQRNEITEWHVYNYLSRLVKGDNQDVLHQISADEKKHYNMLKQLTAEDIQPNRWLIIKYTALARIFGLTFAVKLMEKGEKFAQSAYAKVENERPEIMSVLKVDEQRHEQKLIAMIQEAKLDYMGSMVLGLNDALVELTGALAGLSFALQNTKLVALAGLVTGIAASFSMAASEYLAKKHEGDGQPFTSALYTGTAYIFTVLFLIFPYLILTHYVTALIWTLVNAVIIIFIFTYFNAVTKDLKFRMLFWEMLSISFGVAAFSFGVGLVLRAWFGIKA
ncbi:rubrerythrin family protein [Candidatus Falkowbacteria bacterium CG10_big_fil_rev_8_21_14_0_10_43_11]|uniref:Rubrerythrin family protein n=1 Tax=Candidatus Falkowbacteria bacterium CG10_big_fil_rev_8_21_14_0_10_43_11 TaxID=1974568 RepID=A0A2M6WMZ2_9BACT|nr:MAG: rubrerythrin family protein [Candidatus Falkowbacteria bacterium CG10_big_fil_rev_8_21_14_0_10_43_11]